MEGNFSKAIVLPKKVVKMYVNFWLCEVCIPRTTTKIMFNWNPRRKGNKNGKEREIVK